MTEEEKLEVASFWNIKKRLKRGEFLIQSGQTERYMFFVQKGTFRIFYDIADNEVCVGFSYPNDLILAYPSFISGKPTQYNIQTLTAAELVGITKTNFLELVETIPNLAKAWRILTEQALLGRIEREIDLLTPSPKDRYQRMIERSPHLFQIIPHKYIASYLRMSPETLSRIQKGSKS